MPATARKRRRGTVRLGRRRLVSALHRVVVEGVAIEDVAKQVRVGVDSLREQFGDLEEEFLSTFGPPRARGQA
jgi:hypothetical protein